METVMSEEEEEETEEKKDLETENNRSEVEGEESLLP